MSHENKKSSLSDEPKASGIKLEPPPFEKGYEPESLPKITVPDLPEDAPGLTAEALSQVPTLTELVHEDAEAETAEAASEEITSEVLTEVAEVDPPIAPTESAPLENNIQEVDVQVDTWAEVLHARMGKLTDEIHTLNARLDRLEEKIKIEV
jgi:hypothetical protein